MGEVIKTNIISLTALSLTFTQLELGLKIILLIITIGYTLDKWIKNNKTKEDGEQR